MKMEQGGMEDRAAKETESEDTGIEIEIYFSSASFIRRDRDRRECISVLVKILMV